MQVVLPIIKWLLSKILLIAILVVLALGLVTLKKLSAQWIESQRQRVRMAEFDLKTLVEKSGQQLREAANAVGEKERMVGDLVEDARKIENAMANAKHWYAWLTHWGDAWKKYQQEERDRQEALRWNKEAMDSARKELDGLRSRLQELTSADPNKEAIAAAERRLEMEHHELSSRERFYAQTISALHSSWLDTKAFLLVTVIVVVFGPATWKIIAYYIVGRLASKLPPTVFDASGALHLPEVGESRPACVVPLLENQSLILKEAFLQASGGDVTRRTQYFWKRRFPVLSAVAGLWFLTRITSGKAGGKVTMSSQDNPWLDICRVDLTDGHSVVFRPGLLIGYLVTDQEPAIRVQWRLRSWQSWLTLRFRYFIVTGPASLFFSTGRGFEKEEVLSPQMELRVDRDVPALFTPGLEFVTCRAETFWSYALGRNALFDDGFKGRGTVLCQRASGSRSSMNPESFWGQILSGIGKVFGL